MVVTCQEIDNCSFGSWYPRFKAVTFKSKIVPLSKEFIHYLNAESIYLPKDGQPQAAATLEEIDSDLEDDYDQEEDENKMPLKKQ
ncbi:hypothetical protein G6F68_020876 [Rhizopus microsporus]|nr:hypothetical protein G6F68_020876 [Rhizopus microsporus]